jgi:hypothetical protein
MLPIWSGRRKLPAEEYDQPDALVGDNVNAWSWGVTLNGEVSIKVWKLKHRSPYQRMLEGTEHRLGLGGPTEPVFAQERGAAMVPYP